MDLQAQIREAREIRRKKWEEETKAELAAQSEPAQVASNHPETAINMSATEITNKKRRLMSPTSSDDIEFMGEKKPMSAKRVKVDSDTGMKPERMLPAPQIFSASSNSKSKALAHRKFPTPRLLLTRTPGRSHSSFSPTIVNNTITFQEILGPGKGRGLGIKSAWFYSFFIAQQEFFSELPLGDPGIEIFVGRDIKQDPLAHQSAASLGIPFGADTGNRPLPTDQYRQLSAACQQAYHKMLGSTYHAVYPPIADTGSKYSGCAHSKFGAIQFEGFLRVFITSSNFMSLDFEYSDNHWFVVDFPLLPTKRKKSSPAPEFEQEFLEHATLLGCPASFVNALYGRYDYSSVEERKIKIVTSIPGSHSGETALMYGALRLREVVRPLVKGHKDIAMEICTASIGGMQPDWLRSMYHAFTGGKYDNESASSKEIPEQFRVTFPTRADVEASRTISRQGASQIGSHFKYGESDKRIQKMFHHYKSRDQEAGDPEEGETGAGCLFHQKFYMAMPDGTKVTDSNTRPLWIYIGSANFTKSAWGKCYIDKRRAKVEPGCRRLAEVSNFEMGVVIPGNEIEGMLEHGSVWHDLIPHERNGPAYAGKDKPYNSEQWVMNRTVRDPF